MAAIVLERMCGRVEQKKKKPQEKKTAQQAADAFVTRESLHGDPSGCYTGKPRDGTGRPEQDADDL